MQPLSRVSHPRVGRAIASLGFAAMLLGAVDPMEGSLAILPGAAAVALGVTLQGAERRALVYRWASLAAIALGVGALFVLSALGGIGGAAELSAWWGLLILPYPIGWMMAILGRDSPRWVWWTAMVVSLWFCAVLVLILWKTASNPETHLSLTAGVLHAVVGLATLAACVGRLRRVPA